MNREIILSLLKTNQAQIETQKAILKGLNEQAEDLNRLLALTDAPPPKEEKKEEDSPPKKEPKASSPSKYKGKKQWKRDRARYKKSLRNKRYYERRKRLRNGVVPEIAGEESLSEDQK